MRSRQPSAMLQRFFAGAAEHIFQTKLGETPPKTHNLAYLLEKIGLDAP